MSEMDMSEEACADRGAQFLDEREPDWFHNVNENALYMGDTCQCIMGQLHGWYSAGLNKYGMYSDQKVVEQLGFEVTMEGAYSVLSEAWRKQILDRKLGVGWVE